MKIMNKFPLKISIAALLTITVVAGVYIFYSADKKPVTEPEPVTSLQKQEEPASQTQPKASSFSRLYREGLRAGKRPSKLPEWGAAKQSQSGFADAEVETDPQYVDNSQTTQKSDRQDTQPKGRYYQQRPGIVSVEPQEEQLDIEEIRTRNLQYVNSLRSRQPVERNRPDLAEDVEPVPITEEQMQQMNDDLLLQLLEEYKDNPKQAEQLREILNERMEYLRQQRAAANTSEEDK